MQAARPLIAAVLLAFAAPLHAQTPLLPTGLAYDASGNLYFTDAARHQVFEATLAGALAVIAGSGTQGYAGDNGPATSAQLNSPQAVAIGPDPTLYIADTGNHVVRAVSTAGTISTFAAGFNAPNALAIDATGALLVCDSANHRIRRISNGVVQTIAGNGSQGFSGDNALATAAELDTPSGIAVASDGRIFLADTHNQRVRVISTNGIITTYAGTGTAGFSGDNAAATSAQLASPRGLTITPNGALLIADANNQRIRSVSPQGIITTVAGSSTQGATTDGTPASTAAINTPRAVAISSFGYPAFADAANHTLRLLAADGNLYVPAALSAGRLTTLTLTAASSATVAVNGSVATPQGTVQLLIDGTTAASTTLTSGSATFPLAALTPGTHTLTATYAGDGLNPAATSSALPITIGRATSAVVTQPPAQNSYAGLPLLLNAHVTSTSAGVPTGTVTFSEAGATITSVQLAAGIASGVYLSPAAGIHTIVATYAGDANFSASTAPAVTAVVRPVPDFTVAPSGSNTQTIVAGSIATYALAIAPVADAFSGAVSLSVTGLPKGATATFAPQQVVPGASPATSTLTVQTLATQTVERTPPTSSFYAFLALPLFLLLKRRRRLTTLSLCVIFITGCGTRINPPPSASAGIYTLTVTATGTSVTGALLTHATSLTLNVQ
jgi:sugar lactone lactonase YvrE